METDSSLEMRSPSAFKGMTLSQVCDFVESRHHAYAQKELPGLIQLTERVAIVHGKHDPRLMAVRDYFLESANAFSAHIQKEGGVLFPMIRSLETDASYGDSRWDYIIDPIEQMRLEHEGVELSLEKIRKLTDSFLVPAHACNTYRSMLYGLQAFYANFHQHSDVENNVLFPRALRKVDRIDPE